jgi:plastocyanin
MKDHQCVWNQIRAGFSFFSNYSRHISKVGIGASCLFALAACGGGGGGGGGGNNASAQGGSTTPAPSLTFSSSTVNVAPGDSVTLSWQAQNADSCQASGGWSGDRPTSGSANVGPLQQSQSFSLSCSGTGGGTLREVSVNVSQDTQVSVALNSDSRAVWENGQATLTWNALNADSCEASGAWTGEQALSGSFTSGPLTADSTFKLTCYAQGDSAVALVTVAVTDKTLRWQAPTENVDGSPLTDLAGFSIYWGTSPRDYTDKVDLGASAREWELSLNSGTYYLAVTAFDSDSDESSYSNEVSRIVP